MGLRNNFTYTGGVQHEGLASADINRDGKLDIIGGGYWFEHQGGSKFTAHLVDDAQRYTRAAAGDLKKGGWQEIVFVAGDTSGPLKWYEWNGREWVGHDLLGFDVNHGHSLDIADVDRNGNLDIFCGEMGGRWGKEENPKAKAWVFYGDGRGGFKTTLVSTGVPNHESRLADLNGDSFPDIVSKPFIADRPRIDVFLQKRPVTAGGVFSLDKWERRVIGEKDGRSMFVESADIDADGRTDVVTGAWWFRNPGGGQANWERREVGGAFKNLAAVYDFDNDGDPDLLGTKGAGSSRNSQFAWARNEGAGNFQIFENVERGTGGFLQGVGVARFNIGEPVKVALSWHTPPGEFIQMLTVPADPSQGTWPVENIYNYRNPTKQLDIGDIDIFFVGNSGGAELQWLRNEGGAHWTPFAYFSGAGNKSHRAVLADINRDGRVDGIVGHYREDPGYLAWYEQPASATAKWTEHVIATQADVYGPMSLSVADMDRDGDLDVVVGEHRLEKMETAHLFIFENVDGAGKQWKQHLVHQGDEHHQGARVVDIDRDGDLDILSIGWTHNKVLLYENKSVNDRPIINVWYGDEQKFGRAGNPQRWVNILGSVADPGGIAALTYSLNGGRAQPLTMGSDLRRLARPGDFNIELDRKGLRAGSSEVTITAVERGGKRHTRSIKLDYTKGRTAPLPYSIDWSKVSNIHDAAEVVDGLWRIDSAGIRTVEPYYDRAIAIGDMSWTDYEVTVPVTFHKILPDERVQGPPFSTRAHASLLLRWQGHSDDGKQPRYKYTLAGGLAMFRASTTWEGNRWVIGAAKRSVEPLAEEKTGRVIELNRPYIYKMRAETLPGPQTRYSVKSWDARTAEPPEWDLTAVEGPDDLQSGSLLLVAHHADVTFGNVRVVPVKK